ncbi:MAG: hypothetical protein GY749_19015 [Desulfobacteraceae bacterium]|nr:hypothetical protein [Desulfobacteraceae bacterium]
MDDQKIEDIDEITNEDSVEIQEEQNNTQVDDYPEVSIPDNLPVEPSPICRPGSDCWDVKLTFFHPENRQAQARKVYSYAIDVSNAIPVTVGHVRSWSVY